MEYLLKNTASRESAIFHLLPLVIKPSFEGSPPEKGVKGRCFGYLCPALVRVFVQMIGLVRNPVYFVFRTTLYFLARSDHFFKCADESQA